MPKTNHDHQKSRRQPCLRAASIAFSLLLLVANTSVAHAEGFPEIGNRLLYADALPHYNLGNKYLAKAWYEKAIEKYLDAINIYEFDADVYTNLSVAYRKLGNMPEAEKACRKACELKPDDWTSWSNLANMLMTQENFPESYKTFQKAMKCPGIPDTEKTFIESNIDGMKKIMKARGLTIEGKDIASLVVPKSVASKKSGGKTLASRSGSANGKSDAKATSSAASKNQSGTNTASKTQSGTHKNQLAGTRESEIDTGAYDQWLGGK